MKKSLLLIAGILLYFNISAQTTLTTAVDFTSTDCHGVEINLFDILDGGQYVLIDFFYTTCGPCQIATPKIVEAYNLLGCNEFEVFFMEITPYDNNTACQTWTNTYGIEYPTIGTEGGGASLVSTYGIGAFPTVILIAPDRSIVIQDLWPITNAATIVTALATYNIEQHECGSTPSCPAPNNVVASVYDDNSVQINWDIVSDAVTYNLYMNGDLYQENIENNEIIVTDLEPGIYCFTVTSVCSDGVSDPSSESCVTIEDLNCYPPENVQATVNEDNKITIVWDAVANANSYNVYINNVLMIENYLETTVISPTALSVGTYCITIISDCGGSNLSDPSMESCVTITASISELSNEISIAPNPANSYIEVKCENMQQVTIFNSLGQKVSTHKISGNEAMISTEKFASGLYILRVVNSENKIGTQRFVIYK